MLWVGIDEAGYGPNLGPLVMTAVAARTPDAQRPDLWADPPGHIRRAGGPPDALWVDDSKAITKDRRGRARLELALIRALEALGNPNPSTLGLVLEALGSSTALSELGRWTEDTDPPFPTADVASLESQASTSYPFDGHSWTLYYVHSIVLGPERFNGLLDQHRNKAKVHGDVFRSLLRDVWESTTDSLVSVQSDKHGARNTYYDLLVETFSDVWIERGVEGRDLSAYALDLDGRRLTIQFRPRADADDGLVALASMISKALREAWMDAFNACWQRLAKALDPPIILKPTAGYPTDARRFRADLEAHGLDARHPFPTWWRTK